MSRERGGYGGVASNCKNTQTNGRILDGFPITSLPHSGLYIMESVSSMRAGTVPGFMSYNSQILTHSHIH